MAAVYLSSDLQTAINESFAATRKAGIPDSELLPRTEAAVSLEFTEVLDLTDGAIRTILGVTKKRIVQEDWVGLQDSGQEAITQAIGRIAAGFGIQALLVPTEHGESSKSFNIVYFPRSVTDPEAVKMLNEDDLPEKP